MIKFIGIVMIMCAGTCCGFSLSAKVKKHIEIIDNINSMFTEIIMMINFNAVTFSELIGHLKSCPDIKELKFLDTDLSPVDIRENIVEAVKKNEDNLEDEEVMQLCSFFMQLGMSDLDGQLLMAEKYRQYFQSRLVSLKEESLKKCRLYNSLGVLGGAFLAVILV